MYKPECFYSLTDLTSKNLHDIRKKDELIVGIAKYWDKEKKALIVDLGEDFIGLIPEKELTIEELKYYHSIPIQARAKLTKKICAKIISIEENTIILSRKSLQMEALSKLEINKTYPAEITAIYPYGIYVDICVGLTAFIHISEVTTTRINDIRDLNMKRGDVINGILLSIGNKLCMSYRRAISIPSIKIGDYVHGTIRYELDNQTGYFVEVSPNECGIVDSILKNGKKINMSYGTNIKCKVVGIKFVSETNGTLKTQYKLRLTN